MKKLLVVGIVVIALIAVVAFLLLSNLNSFVAKAIEKEGSEVTRTDVRVAGVDISLREGRGSIKGLEIASPSGYVARTALSLEDIAIDIDMQSVRGNPVVIDEIRIQAPVVYAEVTKTGASNIDELRTRVKAHAAGKGGGGASGESTKRIRIERFTFEKGRIEVDASALGLEKSTIELPEIRLEGVGGAAGAPPEKIAQIILSTFAEKTVSAISNSELDRLIDEKLGGSITDKAKELLEKIGN